MLRSCSVSLKKVNSIPGRFSSKKFKPKQFIKTWRSFQLYLFSKLHTQRSWKKLIFSKENVRKHLRDFVKISKQGEFVLQKKINEMFKKVKKNKVKVENAFYHAEKNFNCNKPKYKKLNT